MPSPNMGLNIPSVATTPGPQYAQDINSSLNKIDAHDHSTGQGAQIPAAALNINADVNMNSHGLTNTSIINLASQALAPASGTLYRNNADLWYADGSGNNVRITQGGSVAVSGAVGFTGLPFGTASASYNNLNQTFKFESATNTAANIDAGALTIREILAGANGITISSPAALAASYALELPSALPGSTSALLLDNVGHISTSGTVNSFSATNLNVLSTASIKNDTGVLEFKNSLDSVQFASVTGTSSGLTLNLPDTADSYTFKVNNVTKAEINNSGINASYLYGSLPAGLVPSAAYSASAELNNSVTHFGVNYLWTTITIACSASRPLLVSLYPTTSWQIWKGPTGSTLDQFWENYLFCVVTGPGGYSQTVNVATYDSLSSNGATCIFFPTVFLVTGNAGTYTLQLYAPPNQSQIHNTKLTAMTF